MIASSNGPVHFLELPCRVDEQAVLGWADCPSPSYHYDYAHVQGWASAAGALYGPRHGGANEAGSHMLTEIGSVDRGPQVIEDVKLGKGRLHVFGQRRQR